MFKNIYNSLYSLYDTNLGRIVAAALVVITFFVLALTPYFIYISNNKFFGDANDAYMWMPITSICIVGAGLLGVFIWLIYNTVKSK